MTRHLDPTPLEPSGEYDQPTTSLFDGGLATEIAVFAALAGASAWGSRRVTVEPWHTALAVVAVLTGLYAAYLVVALAGLVLVVQYIDMLVHGKRGWIGRHWPLAVWPPVLTLALAWPLIALFAGYDAEEWLWQGGSVYGGILAVLAIFFQRKPSDTASQPLI